MCENPPAFPLIERGPHCNEGMTLRDWFAGQVLPTVRTTFRNTIREGTANEIARECYSIADAMLAERERR